MYDFLVPVLNFLRRQVGLRTDVASSAGSAHAKLSYIAANTGIKSIQRGVITLGVSDTTKAATISAIATNKAMVNFLGVSVIGLRDNTSADPDNPSIRSYYTHIDHGLVRLQLTNGTTMTATRAIHRSVTAAVSYEVIEYV
jgi:hypothetical protein